MNDFKYYRISQNGKDQFVMSNLFQFDMLDRMFNGVERVSCSYMNPFCNLFTLLKDGKMFNVYVFSLFPEECLTVKKWKRVYKI